MEVARLYRSLLKLIHAAKCRPHHLQDIRFILSYPLVQSAGGDAAAASSSGERGEAQRRRQQQLQQQHVDPARIVRICLDDLRHALLAPRSPCGKAPSTSPTTLSPVAQQFIYVRQLVWLKTRLENVLSDATDAMLGEAHMVASELTKRDVLDDDVFVRDNHKEDEPSMCWGTRSCDSAEHEIKSSATAVASAGELGLRREMFLLRHTSSFPLVKEYLSSFSLDRQAVAALSAASNQEMVNFLQKHISRRVASQNMDLALHVSVRPFDPAASRSFVGGGGGGGPFAQAHRYFMLHFTLKPHDPVTRIDVVNSYFLRLDVALSELVEDVGYIHASHVWKLGQALQTGCSMSENEIGSGDKGPRLDDAETEFELSFLNPSDNPMLLKGQLYYILRADGDERPVSEIPLRVISFGHLLLNAEG